MSHRYSLIVLFVFLIAGLAWWGRYVPGSVATSSEFLGATLNESLTVRTDPMHGLGSQTEVIDTGKDALRRELLEALDRLITYELYYRSIYGRFTKLMSRVGMTLPQRVSQVYQIQIVEATADRLRIAAFSDAERGKPEYVTVDQDFKIQANFKIPLARVEYLRFQAMKHLRQLSHTQLGQSIEEQGLFKGYFRFEVRPDSEGQKVAFAVGIRQPVVGVRLQYGLTSQSHWEQSEDPHLDLVEFPDFHRPSQLGQDESGDVLSSEEEVRLAQKIFYGEIGRYAKTMSELSKIVTFQFEPTLGSQTLTLDKKNQETDRHLSSVAKPLEIEAIPSKKESK